MKATAKHNVNYNGVWYKCGDVFDVADNDAEIMNDYCNFEKESVLFGSEATDDQDEAPKRRGRPRKED